MESHVANFVRNSLYQLRQLRSVQQSLTLDAWRTVATVFIASRLDYCNAVLYGAMIQVMQQLQMVMNATARMVTGCDKHVTAVLHDILHWLPVPH